MALFCCRNSMLFIASVILYYKTVHQKIRPDPTAKITELQGSRLYCSGLLERLLENEGERMHNNQSQRPDLTWEQLKLNHFYLYSTFKTAAVEPKCFPVRHFKPTIRSLRTSVFSILYRLLKFFVKCYICGQCSKRKKKKKQQREVPCSLSFLIVTQPRDEGFCGCLSLCWHCYGLLTCQACTVPLAQ